LELLGLDPSGKILEELARARSHENCSESSSRPFRRFSFIEPPKVEKKERRVEQRRAPSIFTSMLTPFSKAKAREFFQRVSNTPVRILFGRYLLLGL